jgi:transposase InsO family protein
MDSKAEKIALFRYGVIATLVLEKLPRGELIRRARELADREYDIPFSDRRRVCVDTLLHWSVRYRTGGLEALAPRPRSDRGKTRIITPQVAQLIERLRRENPHRNGTTLLRELALVSEDGSAPLSESSLYRFLKNRGLTKRELLRKTGFKKFEAEYANQIWQSDVMFGPYVERDGGGKRQCFLCAILDDASRLIPHAEFYPEQGLESLLHCLRQAMAARGIPIRLYVDNGKIYRSRQLERIGASVGILIVHTPPYQPEGRGKIERFFRHVREGFLASIDPRQVRTLDDLNARFQTWLESAYHREKHGALETTPLQRWQRDIEQIRQLPPSTDLRRLFFYRVDRLVRRDSTFLIFRRFYEAPSHLAGRRIEVRFDPLDPIEMEIHFEGQLQATARPVDAVVNAQLPPKAKTMPVIGASTGINYVELLQNKHEQSECKPDRAQPSKNKEGGDV